MVGDFFVEIISFRVSSPTLHLCVSVFFQTSASARTLVLHCLFTNFIFIFIYECPCQASRKLRLALANTRLRGNEELVMVTTSTPDIKMRASPRTKETVW